MRTLYLILTFLTLTLPAKADSTTLLTKLDSLINVKDDFNDDRRQKIGQSLADLKSATTDADHQEIYRTLYSLYRTYRCDSAMIMAFRRLESARRLNDSGKLISASLNLAESQISARNGLKAIAILDTIDRGSMKDYHQAYLFKLYIKALSSLADNELLPSERLKFKQSLDAYRDSLLGCLPDSTEQYLREKSALLASHSLYDEALANLQSYQSSNDVTDPRFFTLAGDLHDHLGDKPNAIDNYAKAAIIDIENGVKTHRALMKLAMLLNETGDHQRAYDYITRAFDDASEARAVELASEILEAAPVIEAAYLDKELRYKSRLKTYLAAVCLLLGFLAAALIIVVKQLRANRLYSRRLSAAKTDLDETNAQLTEANEAKERYIIELFDALSKNIDAHSSANREMSRLLKASQFDAALSCARSQRASTDEIKDLYSLFDNIFLSLYPNFIADFNTIATSDYKENPQATSLTPELRVLALMRCGITNSGEIARVLHYNPQTVYNYKFRLKSIITLAGDDLSDYLKHMGR